jgi:hypothetical protein
LPSHYLVREALSPPYHLLMVSIPGSELTPPQPEPASRLVDDRPTAEELEHLYASLTRDERDELFQELLVAAAHGGEAIMAVVDAWLVDRAVGSSSTACTDPDLERRHVGRTSTISPSC